MRGGEEQNPETEVKREAELGPLGGRWGGEKRKCGLEGFCGKKTGAAEVVWLMPTTWRRSGLSIEIGFRDGNQRRNKKLRKFPKMRAKKSKKESKRREEHEKTKFASSP